MKKHRIIESLGRGAEWASHGLNRRLQRLADRAPRAHLALTTLLALGGYVWLLALPFAAAYFSIRTLVLAQEGGGAWLYAHAGLALAFGIGTWAIVRLRFKDPEGVLLTREEAPRLFRQIELIRRKLHAAPIHKVHVTERFGVELVRLPRNGLPVTYENHLLIGYPALACLSQGQLKALIAGRIGEISVHNMGVTAWLCQLRQTWVAYRVAWAGRRSPLALVMRFFFERYAPFYSRISAPLVNGREFRSDQYALQAVPDETLAGCLTMEVVVERFLDDYYWPKVYRSAEKAPQPRFRAYTNLGLVFARKFKGRNPQLWVREAFTREPDPAGGPGLRERLEAIGFGEPVAPAVPRRTAAEALLGETECTLSGRLDARWMAREQENWVMRYQRGQSARGKLQRLRKLAEEGRLRGKQAMEYAALTKKYGTEEEARAAYERILELNPDDARINFGVGKYLVSLKDPRGVQLLERAMELDKHCVSAACRLISSFVVNTHSQETLRQYVEDNVIHGQARSA